MKIGFTGTRFGMTPRQREHVRRILEGYVTIKTREFHHGDCVGADEQADQIARDLGYAIFIHPPTDDSHRAFCDRREPRAHLYRPLPHLTRNRGIVDSAELLIAAPPGREELQRSGTWSTVRYARRTECEYVVVFPEGVDEFSRCDCPSHEDATGRVTTRLSNE